MALNFLPSPRTSYTASQAGQANSYGIPHFFGAGRGRNFLLGPRGNEGEMLKRQRFFACNGSLKIVLLLLLLSSQNSLGWQITLFFAL